VLLLWSLLNVLFQQHVNIRRCCANTCYKYTQRSTNVYCPLAEICLRKAMDLVAFRPGIQMLLYQQPSTAWQVQPTPQVAGATNNLSALRSPRATMAQTQTAVQIKSPNEEMNVHVVKDAPVPAPSSGQVCT
jgi:hypothetical protein